MESARYPFQTIGVGEGLDVGRRGSGGQGSAAHIWGVSVQEYLQLADPWPLNPKGELMLGLKIENRRALENSEASTSVPGIAFAEWGPSRHGDVVRIAAAARCAVPRTYGERPSAGQDGVRRGKYSLFEPDGSGRHHRDD